ncbi:MAG: alpha/beta hydrolase [Propionibacteriales bacterium]|nr:alpha/beta hydrolase [Propionibacteriales bacterium]
MGDLVTAGADQLWVDDTGGPGVPLVLLHPGIMDSTIWDATLPLLGDHRVVRFDRRGFGRSPRATEPFNAMADLVTVLDHLGADRAHLVGNSMGGETSLALAVTQPDRVASMTLLCPGIGGYPWPDPSPDEAELYRRYGEAKKAQDIDTLVEIGLGEWCRSGVDDYLTEQMRRSTESDFAQGDLEQDNPEQWDLLDKVTVPTTVIAGELDPADSLQGSLDLAGKIPGAELVRLDVDHLPQYRDPEAVAGAVLRTVSRAEG